MQVIISLSIHVLFVSLPQKRLLSRGELGLTIQCQCDNVHTNGHFVFVHWTYLNSILLKRILS